MGHLYFTDRLTFLRLCCWLSFSRGFRVQLRSNMFVKIGEVIIIEITIMLDTMLKTTSLAFLGMVMACTDCLFVPYFPFKTYPVLFYNSDSSLRFLIVEDYLKVRAHLFFEFRIISSEINGLE